MVILLSGKQGSGKSTLKNSLLNHFKLDATSARFAQPIYEIHDLAMSVLKKYGMSDLVKSKDGKLLQLLGTEWGREMRETIWVDCLSNFICGMPKNLIVVVEDCRFKNEIDLLKFRHGHERGCISIRLTCDEEIRKGRADSWRDNVNHPSEIDLDEYESMQKFDAMIDTGKVTTDQCFQIVCSLIKERSEEYGYSFKF